MVGQLVALTVHTTVRGLTPNLISVDFGDGIVLPDDTPSCPPPATAYAASPPFNADVTTPAHQYLAPGRYAVSVTVGFPCIRESSPSTTHGILTVDPGEDMPATPPSAAPSPTQP